MTQLDLSIVIPAFNEHTKIARDIQQASAFLTTAGLQGEILVVDDGSTDATADVARQSPVHDTVPCRVIALETNQGKGHAVKTGIIASKGQYILFADSGGCIPYGKVKIGMDLIQAKLCGLIHGMIKSRVSMF